MLMNTPKEILKGLNSLSFRLHSSQKYLLQYRIPLPTLFKTPHAFSAYMACAHWIRTDKRQVKWMAYADRQ